MVFAFYMTSLGSGIPSELSFGFIDKTKFDGDLHWMPIKLKHMFGVQLDDLKFGGKSSGICKNKQCLVTFDTGTSYMAFPPTAIEALGQAGVPFSNHVKRCKSA